uniref:BRCT domain-containing protein n=1 Tax=Parastrongyloides trichosuri TaxID=131310 RepID=A0A0N4ZU29_PARTI
MEKKFDELDNILKQLKDSRYKKFMKWAEKEVKKISNVIKNDDGIENSCDLSFAQIYNSKNYNFDLPIIIYINFKDPKNDKLFKKIGFCVEYTGIIDEAIFHPIDSNIWTRHEYFKDISILKSLAYGRRIILYTHIDDCYQSDDPSKLYSLSYFIPEPINLFNGFSFLVEESFFNHEIDEGYCKKLTDILKKFGATIYTRMVQMYDTKNVYVITNLCKEMIDSDIEDLYNAKAVSLFYIYDSIWHQQALRIDAYIIKL